MEIARVIIPRHIREVQMSLSQRAKYFEWNGTTIRCPGFNIPKAFYRTKEIDEKRIRIGDLKSSFLICGVNKKGKIISYIRNNNELITCSRPPFHKYILFSLINGEYEPVVANPNKVGTPRRYIINGQDIYNGALKEFDLGKVMGAIKECYKPFIEPLPVIYGFPIKIRCEIYDTIKSPYTKGKNSIGHRWDVDNYSYPYLKAFPDLLVAEGKIRDDDRLYIPGTIGTDFIPIDNHENRMLIFIISKVDRREITENIIYQKYHENPDFFEKEIVNEGDTGYKQLNLNL